MVRYCGNCCSVPRARNLNSIETTVDMQITDVFLFSSSGETRELTGVGGKAGGRMGEARRGEGPLKVE